MKTILIHGEDIGAVEKRLLKITAKARERGYKIYWLDKTNLQDIKEKMLLQSLFDEKAVYLVDLKELKRKDIEWLKDKKDNLAKNVVFYYKGKLPRNFLEIKKKEVYNPPPYLWEILYKFFPGNWEEVLRLYSKVSQREQGDLFLYLLARHLGDIFIFKKDPSFLDYPFWRKRKIAIQARYFNTKKLKSVIKELARVNYLVKKSTLSSDFLIEMFIIKSLK